MQLGDLIKKRFIELDEQSAEVLKQKVYSFTSDQGQKYYTIPYSIFKGWATRVLNLLQRGFGETSIHYKQFNQHVEALREYESDFQTCREIFLAAKDDFEGGYLFNVRGMVKAELLNSGYKDPACVLAGVTLETTLKELCTLHGIAIAKLDKMNADLCKAGIYNMAKQKQVTAWAELRNNAAHGEWSKYNEDDVRDFLDGVQRFVADYM